MEVSPAARQSRRLIWGRLSNPLKVHHQHHTYGPFHRTASQCGGWYLQSHSSVEEQDTEQACPGQNNELCALYYQKGQDIMSVPP